MADSKFNIWWDTIFKEENILVHVQEYWFYDIDANAIKRISWREPRLMTKIDYQENLPNVMQENHLSILAINNWTYRISTANPFRELKNIEHKNVKIINPDMDYKTIDPYKITTESQALDVCYVNGILDEVFWEPTNLTVRGRQRNEMALAFNINKIDFIINGVQIEVDGGYEWADSINLVEAKIWSRNNINIRQLLYPELYWKQKVPQKKTNIFLMYYEEPYFYFLPCNSNKKELCNVNYEDIKIFRFKPVEESFQLSSIKVNNILIDDTVPFPQANDFNKVIAMLSYIWNGIWSKLDLRSEFDFVERQRDYYFNVLLRMKLCNYEDKIISLTELGNTIYALPFQKKIIEISKIVFSNKIFNDGLQYWVGNIDLADFEKLWIGTSTTGRRIQTVKKWISFFTNILSLEPDLKI